MKYESQTTDLKNLLASAKNILIAVPSGADIDKLSAGLSLFLVLESAGKEVSIVSDDNILVGQSHLFGIDHVQKTLPSTEGGNLTLVLEGVAASDNTIPSLEKLDWYAQDSNLNLVFHVLPGQTFQPAKIVPKYQGAGFNLIFTIGASNLNALGAIYSQNQAVFSGTHIVNVDTQAENTSFGQTNILDKEASSLSEIVANLIATLGFNLDADAASNLLTGIFDSTSNLSDAKATAETYMVVANCLRVGGKKPQSSVLQKQEEPKTENPFISSIPQQPTYDWNAVSAAIGGNIPVIQPAADSNTAPIPSPEPQPSPEERPLEEGVVSETFEPEWLTPKIFKGSSLG